MGYFSDGSIDRVRKFWDDRPCNIRHSPQEIGTRQYFEEVEARKYLVEPHIPRFAQFSRWADRRVLEIGCGIGTDTISFARAGAKVTAVDISSESIALARRRAELFGLDHRIEFIEADAEEMSGSVRAEPYDLIYSFGVIHHTPHPTRVMDQVRENYVRRGSVLKFMVYNRYSTKALGILLRHGRGAVWRFDELISEHSEAQTGCPVTYTYSINDIPGLLGEGFFNPSIKIDHIFPYQVAAYGRFQYRKRVQYRLMPDWLFRAFERQFGWHLCVTATAVGHQPCRPPTDRIAEQSDW